MGVVNLFYASDKAIYDALQQHKYTKSALKELFLSRGIIVSNETEKDDVAKYFSSFNHDYFDHQSIANVLGVGHRKEKTSVTNINNEFSDDAVEEVSLAIKAEYEKNGDAVSVNKRTKGFELKIIYTQLDYNKSEFKQVIEREAIISVETNKSGLAIRWPHNEYVQQIKERLLDLLSSSDELDGDLDIEEIELVNFELPKSRTDFFVKLYKNMKGYQMSDVTDVQVYHPKVVSEKEDDLGVHIFKAALKGEGVHASDELSSLYKKGFYLSKITWIAKTDSYDSDLYELEAQFMDAESCKNFSYLVKGVYKNLGKGEHAKGRASLTQVEELRLGRLIEESATKAISLIEKELLKPEE